VSLSAGLGGLFLLLGEELSQLVLALLGFRLRKRVGGGLLLLGRLGRLLAGLLRGLGRLLGISLLSGSLAWSEAFWAA